LAWYLGGFDGFLLALLAFGLVDFIAGIIAPGWAIVRAAAGREKYAKKF